MSTPGLLQVWSLDTSSDRESAKDVDFGVWAANSILRYRAGANNLAFLLNITPHSETRLRDEGIIPFYHLTRNITSTLKASARELGVTVPDIPNPPEDWNKEASTDSKALAAEILPLLAEPVRPIVEWMFTSRDRNPGLHWTSRLAVSSVVPELLTRTVLAMDGTVGGSEWASFVAQVTGKEFKEISRVVNEELLRIRAQPGSGWNEEEARRVVEGQLANLQGMMNIGT